MNKAAINLHVKVFVHMFSFHLGVEFWGCMVKVFLALRETAKLFPKVLHYYQQNMSASVASHPLQHLILSVFLNLPILVFTQWYHIVAFKFHYLGD